MYFAAIISALVLTAEPAAHPFAIEVIDDQTGRGVPLVELTTTSGATYITDSACTVWNGWHLWAAAVNTANSLDRGKVISALESGISFQSPEGSIKLDSKSHHVLHSVHLAKVNERNGFSIMQSFANVEPADTMKVCDLLANPNEHKQFTPKF